MNLTNPFPGLRSFDYEESHLFFGRETHIDDLLKKLSRNHFVAIVGTSGSGKSSLVRAGLLPTLEKESSSESKNPWIITTMKPGNTPLENMARSLLTKPEFNTDENDQYSKVTDVLEASSLGLVQVTRKLLPEGKKLLILLDQFEETFRYSGSGIEVNDKQSAKFVQLIIDAIRQRDVPIFVILTIRSDFLGDCARFEGLPEAINDGHYLVPRLNTDQNRSVITGPVHYANGKISPRLVQKLIGDLGDNPDQLPVLQHSLMRTWDKWVETADQGEPMDLRHYEMTGTMQNALSLHADEAFEELNAKQKLLIEKIFKSITVKTGENRGVRRPTSLTSLVNITKSSESEIISALEPFRKTGRTFILPEQGKNINSNTIIDISHESLMRSWMRLKNWVEEESESAELYSRLCTSALLHKDGLSALWRDPELQVALDWGKREEPNEFWANQYNNDYKIGLEFLKASESSRTRELASSKRTRQLVRGAVVIFLFTVSSLTIWALFQTKKAKENFAEAQLQTQEALNQKQLAEKSETMALDASKKALSSKEYAELQSNIAQEQKILAEEQKRRAESEAQRAKRQELFAIEQQQLAEKKSKEALLEKQRAEISQNEATRLRMLELSQNLAFKSLEITDDVQLKTLLSIEAYKLARSNGGEVNNPLLYSSAYDATVAIDERFKDIQFRVPERIQSIQANQEAMALITSSGTLKFYNIKSLENTRIQNIDLGGSVVNTAYLNENGKSVVVGTEDFKTVFHDAKSGNSRSASVHSGFIRAAEFSRDGKTIATGARDSSVVIYENNTLKRRVKFSSRIKALAFHANQKDLFVGCDDGQLFLLVNGADSPVKFAASPGARLQSLAVDFEGDKVVAGYSNGNVNVFDGSGRILRKMNEAASVDHIVISENLIIVGTARPRIKIYNSSNDVLEPIEIKAINSPIIDMEVSQPYIYVACKDRSVRTYPCFTSYFEKNLLSNLKRNFTADEWKSYIGDDLPYHKTVAN